MAKTLILVDYENIQSVPPEGIPKDAEVLFVCGAKQTTLPIDLFMLQQALGARFRIARIGNVQRNAVDFCVAFYLGEALANEPDRECLVLSKDKKAFDPLIAHLTGERGLKVRRIESLAALKAKKEPSQGNDLERAITLFAREKSQPKSSVALRRKLKSYFPSRSDEERATLAAALFARKVFVETPAGVEYRGIRGGTA